MLDPQQVEGLVEMVAAMDRPALIEKFLTFQGAFPVDFTHDFLSAQPLERLRHIFVALCIQNGVMPQEAMANAA
jgi:hypothetical protein